MKNLGIILIVLGSLALIACAFLPFAFDLADQNPYTWGSVFLIIAGLITHIIVNKKVTD